MPTAQLPPRYGGAHFVSGGTAPLALPASPSGLSAGPLANPAFRRLWLAQSASQLGDRVHQLALMWWTLQATGSLAATGLVLIATTLPAVLIGPVAGAVADRWPRRPVMLACDALRALLVGLVAVLAQMGDLSVPVVVVASGLLASLTAVFTPASMAMLPSVVPPDDLLKANSLVETTTHGAGLVGPAIGGVLVAALGPAGAFAFNALTFLASGAMLLGVRFPETPPRAEAEPFLESMKAGFRLLGAQPTIAGLLGCFAVLNFFSISILLFLPYFARTVFKVGAPGLGLMEGAIALGMLMGALSAGQLTAVGRRFPVILGAVAGTAATFVVMGTWPIYGLFLALLAVTGALFGAMNVVTMAFFQSRVPASEMGRFMGLLTSVVFALMPVSNGVFGLLAGRVAPDMLLALNGGCIGLIALALFAVPGLKDA